MLIQVILALILIPSVVIHEVAHGLMALKLGDPTAKNQGRLTLNPIPHIDLLGSIVIPAMLIMSGTSFIIGWAKPVPINPIYFKNPNKGMMWVALAGPASNIGIAIIAALILRVSSPDAVLLQIPLILAIQLNLVLAIFNLFPVPPLDGSRVLMYISPPSLQRLLLMIEPYGILVVAVLSYFGAFGPYLNYLVTPIYSVLVK
jgi:Zn-dependent protease